MSSSNLAVRLKQLEYGRVQATVYDEDGLIIDQFIGDNPDDALALARREYKVRMVLDADNYTHPHDGGFTDIDQVVREIIIETEELRGLGLLAPFVEGTPIGVIPPHHRADLKPKRRKRVRTRGKS